MKYLGIIQARCGSTRLPNKVLKPLAGKPAVLRMVERAKRSKYLDEVVVATSEKAVNLPLVAACAQSGVRVFVGSEDDVLDRYFQVARLLKPEYVIRLTADCPCFDPALLDDAIDEMDDGIDFLVSSSETLPDGLGFAVVKFEVLRTAWREAKLASEREHVTLYIANNREKFRCQDYLSRIGNHGDERWTVDEPEDYELVSTIFDHFVPEGGDAKFTYAEILDFLDSHPELRKINAMYARDEGLVKSLQEDHIVDFDPDE